jgi:ACR3 family arsenite transporter
VALEIIAGIFIGHLEGDKIQAISNMEIAQVNIPVAILIWLMVYPMMLQIKLRPTLKVTPCSDFFKEKNRRYWNHFH